jgi:hypothetical protein
LISEKWLDVEDPGRPAFENVSLDKYYRIIGDFGGWELFQQLLRALRAVAQRHGVSIANVASRYVLDQPQVGAIIIGARSIKHLRDNLAVSSLPLDTTDYAEIEAVLANATGPSGDCYEIDRAENRDALEEVKTRYFDIEGGHLVEKTRAPVVLAEPYAPYLALKK